jgi:glutathione synthase/RimK-type ligase-like ATP-grasp enzyme
MTIVILGSADDEHAVVMHDVLRRRGADAELLDARWFPAQMTVSFDPHGASGSLQWPTGRRLEFSGIQAVYWRSFPGVEVPPLEDAEQAYIAFNDSRSLFETLLIQLPARWINGWQAYQLHQTKPVQLARIAALGAKVPPTLLTNDAAELKRFAARHARLIFKPVQGGDHAQRLTEEQLTPENLSNLAYAPITVQAEVPGTNIRVFVVGEQVMACEVRSAALDFRDDPQPELGVHDLGADLQALCRRIARELHLVWTGIDFRRTPAGEYWFLEANPSPMFLGFESQTGLPLTKALADLLMITS